MEEMDFISANMIVWLDESGSDRRNGRRMFGHHLRGMTPLDYTLTLRGKRLSSIAIMSTRGIEDIDTFEGSINGDTFSDFITRCLVPLLQPFDGQNGPYSLIRFQITQHRSLAGPKAVAISSLQALLE